jgi:hypothetical protein
LYDNSGARGKAGQKGGKGGQGGKGGEGGYGGSITIENVFEEPLSGPICVRTRGTFGRDGKDGKARMASTANQLVTWATSTKWPHFGTGYTKQDSSVSTMMSRCILMIRQQNQIANLTLDAIHKVEN